jgi:hypothetical protein
LLVYGQAAEVTIVRIEPFLLRLISFAVVTFSLIPRCGATVVTFDDLSETGSGSYLTASYQGLVWSNFLVNNSILFTNVLPHFFPGAPSNGLSGNYYGMVSASNVAVNGIGNPAEIDSMGTNFNFHSAYLTGEWNSNLNIEVQGFRGGSLVYSQVVVASAISPTLFTFDYENIDRLYFSNLGGDPAFGTPSAPQLILDNLTFEFVPEPSTILLTGAGAALLLAFRKRKRA